MDENNFGWLMATICCCVLVLGIGSCSITNNIQDNRSIERMVQSGADPMRARCAVRDCDRGIAIILGLDKKN